MILIVDDNQENIFSLKALLTLHGFEVDTALSGAEALKRILQRTYSLIILDVQMPEMDGFEVAEAASGYSRSRDIPIIFLSAVNTHKKFIAKGYESGGFDYVTKPFDPDILLMKVKTFYRLSEQTHQLKSLEQELRTEIERRKDAERNLEKKVEERTRELVRANARLAESNKDLQQFAFIASHDLQEPLRKIQTFSNLALERYLDDKEKLKGALEKIYASAHRLRDLVADLLSYSRINAEHVFVSTDMNALVEEAIADLEVAVRAQQPAFEIGPLPAVEVIPTQMRQVFQNLISNSLKFSRDDLPTVIRVYGERVAAKAVDAAPAPDGNFCRITVHDNGIGFNENFKARIFEIFQQLNPRDVYGGTGIGLSIVKKIVERHEGIIHAQGREMEGATFVIVVPIRHTRPAEPLETTL